MRHPNPASLPETPNPRCTVCWRELTSTPTKWGGKQAKPHYRIKTKCSNCGATAQTGVLTIYRRIKTLEAYQPTNPENKTPQPPANSDWEKRGLCSKPTANGTKLRNVALQDRPKGQTVDDARILCAKCPVQKTCLQLTTSMKDEAYLFAGVQSTVDHQAVNGLPQLGYEQEDILTLINDDIYKIVQQRLNHPLADLSNDVENGVELLKGLRGVFTIRPSNYVKANLWVKLLPIGSVVTLPGGDFKIKRTSINTWEIGEETGLSIFSVSSVVRTLYEARNAGSEEVVVDLQDTQPLKD